MLELNHRINASLVIVTHDSRLANRAQQIKQLIDGVYAIFQMHNEYVNKPPIPHLFL